MHALCFYTPPLSCHRFEIERLVFFPSASPPVLLLFYTSLVVEQVLHRIPHNPSVGRQVQLSTNHCQQLLREEHLREAKLVE